jgi:hypothetical protein
MHVERIDWSKAPRWFAETLGRAHWTSHDDKYGAESDRRLSLRASVLFIAAVSVTLWIVIVLSVLQFV